MLTHSFIFLTRFGYSRERKLWEQGIVDWDSFLSRERIRFISRHWKERYDKQILEAMKSLSMMDLSFFQRYLPKREVWRVYHSLRHNPDFRVFFLDIETDNYGNLTVISLFDGEDCKTFIRGFNLDFSLLKKLLNNASMLITFNGSSFDIPILRHYVRLSNNILHFDLRPLLVRLGYNMGLKEIESKLGIERSDEVRSLRGFDALQLWKYFKREKNKECLRLLIEYNRYDAINLKPIADFSVNKIFKKTLENLDFLVIS